MCITSAPPPRACRRQPRWWSVFVSNASCLNFRLEQRELASARQTVPISSPSATGAPCNGVLDTRGLELRNTVYAFRLSNPTCEPARHHARSPGRRRGRYSVHSPHHSESLRVLPPMRGQLKGKSSKLPGLFACSQYLTVQQKYRSPNYHEVECCWGLFRNLCPVCHSCRH